jgi:CRP-like cAMP-binding protein
MTPLHSFATASSPWGIKAGPDTNPLVRKLQGLASLTAADLSALEQISTQARLFGSHTDLIPENVVSEDAFVVLDGFACRYKELQSGARQITDYLLPGDICGSDVTAVGPLDHTVGTLSPCVVARIPRHTFRQLKQRSAIADALHLVDRIEVSTTRTWVVNVGCRPAVERVAHLFCELLVRLEAVGLASHGVCPLPLTQVDLAQTLGLSNVHVNRTLQELRRQGLIELKGRTLRLLDKTRLQAIAEFNPAYLRPRLRIEKCLSS